MPRANVGTSGLASRPGRLIPGGRGVPLVVVTRPELSVCVRGGDYRRVSVAGLINRVSVGGGDYRRVSVAARVEQPC